MPFDFFLHRLWEQHVKVFEQEEVPQFVKVYDRAASHIAPVLDSVIPVEAPFHIFTDKAFH